MTAPATTVLVYQEACERESSTVVRWAGLRCSWQERRCDWIPGCRRICTGEQDGPVRTSFAGTSVRSTKREIEVAGLIAEGLTNKEIAARLVISPRTAQGHVEHLLVKLGVTSRRQIAAWFVESKKRAPRTVVERAVMAFCCG